MDLTDILNSAKHARNRAVARIIVDGLNELLDYSDDVRANILGLVNLRAQCSEDAADHPSLQVYSVNDLHYLGLLGVLNGIVGARPDGGGYIALAEYSDGTCRFVVGSSELDRPIMEEF